MSEPVTREEFNLALERLRSTEARIDEIDRGGTRGVGVLAVQVKELAKDVSAVESQLEAHRKDHVAEARARVVSRRWAIGIGTVLFAALESPLIALLAHIH